MEWIKKHADSIAVIGAVAVGVCWMNSQLRSVECSMDDKIGSVGKEVTNLQKEVAIIKTVLIMRGSMPKEFVSQEQKKDNTDLNLLSPEMPNH